jgi:heme exporter protein A
MINLKYEVVGLSKAFVRKQYIFKEVNLQFSNNDVIAVTGSNGSGKSTLIKVLTGVLSHNSGEIKITKDGQEKTIADIKDNLSLVSPYLNLYEEFTPIEHYKISADLRGISFNVSKLNEDLSLFNIFKHRNSQIRNFSSGMKQRMKFVLALQNNPTLLFLDEPTSNLDNEGIEIVNNVIKNHSKQNGIVVIATNEEREKALCSKCYDVSISN